MFKLYTTGFKGIRVDLISIQSNYNTLSDFIPDIYIPTCLEHCAVKHAVLLVFFFFTLSETFRYPGMFSHYV